MKKLAILLGVALSALTVQAGTFKSVSLINCQSLVVSNTIQVTNLLSVHQTTGTNVIGTVFTNFAGTKVTVAAGTSDYFNLLKAVPLWDDGYVITPIYTNQPAGDTLMDGPYYNAKVYIRLVGEHANANSAVTFRLAPVPSAFNPVTRQYPDWNLDGIDANAAADLVTISVTATGLTEVRSLTALDLRKFAGCAGLMLVLINNADTDATSSVKVLECTLNYYAP